MFDIQSKCLTKFDKYCKKVTVVWLKVKKKLELLMLSSKTTVTQGSCASG